MMDNGLYIIHDNTEMIKFIKNLQEQYQTKEKEKREEKVERKSNINKKIVII